MATEEEVTEALPITDRLALPPYLTIPEESPRAERFRVARVALERGGVAYVFPRRRRDLWPHAVAAALLAVAFAGVLLEEAAVPSSVLVAAALAAAALAYDLRFGTTRIEVDDRGVSFRSRLAGPVTRLPRRRLVSVEKGERRLVFRTDEGDETTLALSLTEAEAEWLAFELEKRLKPRLTSR